MADDDLRNRVDALLSGRSKGKTEYKYAVEGSDGYTPTAEPPFESHFEPYEYQKAASAMIDAAYGLTEAPSVNVLAASPTGSGKTFLIKWAAARAVQTGQRLIVAVPLVALAEQIFSQLRQTLALIEASTLIPDEDSDLLWDSDGDEEAWLRGGGDDDYDPNYETYDPNAYDSAEKVESPVGIITGPSEMFVDAPVLVCTYEVVLIRLDRCDARFVERMPLIVIDELHMLADPERGGVPEAILTHPQLPKDVSLVGLSGTLPNKMDVAERLGRCNGMRTCVIGLDRRPIPL